MTKKTYSEKLLDPKWQKKRLKIFERDNFTCTSCSNKRAALHVHHISYTRQPWTASDNQLLTLCESCHEFIEMIQKTTTIGRVKKLRKRVGLDNIAHAFLTITEDSIYLGVDVIIIHRWNKEEDMYDSYTELKLTAGLVDIMKGMIDG